MKYRFLLLLAAFLTLGSTRSSAQSKESTRIEKSIAVLKEFGEMKESIPHELLKMSEGVIIVPKMINAGFVLAGKRGRGVALVRNDDGSWSDPLFITITGGGVGFQAGIQSVDLVLIFKHRQTLEEIDDGTFTLGGDVSATAGPLGRSSSATTDYKFEAEVYSYSKSKGLFAGISLTGSAITVDQSAISEFYGEEMSPVELFSNAHVDDAIVTALKRELRALMKSGR